MANARITDEPVNQYGTNNNAMFTVPTGEIWVVDIHTDEGDFYLDGNYFIGNNQWENLVLPAGRSIDAGGGPTIATGFKVQNTVDNKPIDYYGDNGNNMFTVPSGEVWRVTVMAKDGDWIYDGNLFSGNHTNIWNDVVLTGGTNVDAGSGPTYISGWRVD